MKFEWDERKNQSNFTKHWFDFADAFLIFNLPMIVEFDERENYGENRCIGIGLRKALSHERRRYEQYLKNQATDSDCAETAKKLWNRQ